jgi:hypothetical protein
MLFLCQLLTFIKLSEYFLIMRFLFKSFPKTHRCLQIIAQSKVGLSLSYDGFDVVRVYFLGHLAIL